jgi:hypothetical protein
MSVAALDKVIVAVQLADPAGVSGTLAHKTVSV